MAIPNMVNKLRALRRQRLRQIIVAQSVAVQYDYRVSFKE
jgi:hypothetical protein